MLLHTFRYYNESSPHIVPQNPQVVDKVGMATQAALLVENLGVVAGEVCLVIEEVARMATLHKFDAVVFLVTYALPKLDLRSPKFYEHTHQYE